MRLFICHVSEDKDDFVRPLAEALSKKFDVWYDEFQLTIGDSLLHKIDEGLKTSDFGVVVLSKAFFKKKKWAEAELGGLFALETESRKIILPVWYGVTQEDVRRYSAILADKLAVSADKGLPKVVEEIELAVNTSGRQRQLTLLESASQRMKGLDETLTERRESAKLLGSAEGAVLVKEAQDVVFSAAEKILSEVSTTSGVLKFDCKRHDAVTFSADTDFGLTLHMNLRRLADDWAASAAFTICVFRQADRWEKKFDILTEKEFAPSFRRDKQVVWKGEGNDRTLSNEELADQAIGMLQAEIERAATRH